MRAKTEKFSDEVEDNVREIARIEAWKSLFPWLIIIPPQNQSKGNRLWKMWRKKNEKSISGAIKVNEKLLWSIWTPWSESPLKISWILFWMKKRMQSATSAGISKVRIDRIPGQEHINGNFWQHQAKLNSKYLVFRRFLSNVSVLLAVGVYDEGDCWNSRHCGRESGG